MRLLQKILHGTNSFIKTFSGKNLRVIKEYIEHVNITTVRKFRGVAHLYMVDYYFNNLNGKKLLLVMSR